MATHLNGPIILGAGSVTRPTAAVTLTAADIGKNVLLGEAAGYTITLPAVPVAGFIDFTVTSAFATTNWVVDSAEGDNISGSLLVAGATVVAAAEDQINFVASAESIGDTIRLTADYANSQWIVAGVAALTGGITATDPS